MFSKAMQQTIAIITLICLSTSFALANSADESEAKRTALLKARQLIEKTDQGDLEALVHDVGQNEETPKAVKALYVKAMRSKAGAFPAKSKLLKLIDTSIEQLEQQDQLLPNGGGTAIVLAVIGCLVQDGSPEAAAFAGAIYAVALICAFIPGF